MAVYTRITVLCPGMESRSYDLESFFRNDIYVGRGLYHGDSDSLRNDISIDVSVVSKSHCKFHRDAENNWYIIDDESLNGLMYNNQRVSFRQLNDGDKIYIGNNKDDPIVMIFSQRNIEDSRQPESEDEIHGVTNYVLPSGSRCVIGRADDCDIVINHPTVSRHHCIITWENGEYYITDNNSTNGVIVNSHSLTGKQVLKQMDRVSIAGFSFVFDNGSLYAYEITGGVSVSAEHLYKIVGSGDDEKQILEDVNLYIEPNKFIAIIGGSGAGKTTLLNCLSGMTDFSYGEVYINGESIRLCGKSLRSLMGYVPQRDIVYDSLTLERMLYYSAKLRMTPDASDEDIAEKIDETLDMVELSAHRETLISRLSGGERKRASIAVELLASPKLFFLDEPSSGLDPGTEKHLMQMLKKLADSGKTVIMITHTVQNLDLCDNVICLGRGGKLCYSGTYDGALRFFGKKSMTDVYDTLNDEDEAEYAAERYRDNYLSTRKPEHVEPDEDENHSMGAGKRLADMLNDFWTMTCRYTEILLHDKVRMLLLLLMPIILTPLVCISFQADGNFYNLILKLGLPFNRSMFPYKVASHTFSLVLSFSCAAFWTGIFNSIQEISKERNIYERERFSGVGVVPYVFSKFVPLFVLCFIQSVCMVAIFRFMTNTTATLDGNINNTVHTAGLLPLRMNSSILEAFVTTFLCVLSAMCLGLAISSIASNEMALVLCPICLMPQILFANVASELSGFTLTLSNIISCKWSSLAFILAAKANNTLYESCKLSGGIWEYGDEYTDAYRYTGEIREAWLALAIICVVCVAASILILKFRKRQTR